MLQEPLQHCADRKDHIDLVSQRAAGNSHTSVDYHRPIPQSIQVQQLSCASPNRRIFAALFPCFADDPYLVLKLVCSVTFYESFLVCTYLDQSCFANKLNSFLWCRGIIPPLGGTLDLSPILAFVALDVSSLFLCRLNNGFSSLSACMSGSVGMRHLPFQWARSAQW